MKNEKIIDTKHFHDYVGHDAEETSFMIDLFIQQAKTCQSELIQSYEQENNNEWHDAAHKLKGIASFAGAKTLQNSSLTAQNNHEADKQLKQRLLNQIKKDISDAISFFENLKSEKQ